MIAWKIVEGNSTASAIYSPNGGAEGWKCDAVPADTKGDKF